MPVTDKQMIGKLGEELAADFLRNEGYTIVTQNVHLGKQEIDIIAEDNDFFVFVEVKTRSMAPGEASRYGSPSDAVDAHKRYYVTRAAKTYTRLHPTRKKLRFDVIEVYLSHDEQPKILAVRHMKDAFRAYS